MERAQLLAPAGSRYAALERSSRAWLVLHRTHEPVVLQPDSCTWADSPPQTKEREDLIPAFTPPPPFNIQWSHLGLSDYLFQRNLPDYIRKTWSPEHGFQLTPSAVMFHREYAPGNCALFRFDLAQHLSVHQTHYSVCPVLSVEGNTLATLEDSTFSGTN